MTDKPAPLLDLRGISKSFGGIKALTDINFSLTAGEIHALAGENGAGKSTLMNIISGIHKADTGSIAIDGEPVAINDPLDAQKLGIAIVHQEIALCPDVSVAENIMMPATGSRRSWFMNYRALRRKAETTLRQLANIPPDTILGKLSISNQQLVEIARALTLDCKILILDEPTAALTESEAKALFLVMQKLKQRGIAIIYISHRMSEIFAQCDRITILRDGRFISTDNVSEITPNQVIRRLVGREISALYPPKQASASSERLLDVEGLSDGQHIVDVGFTLKRGEILGIGGLIGSGRTETLQSIAGLRRRTGGRVTLLGQNFSPNAYPDAVAKGLVYLSENRKAEGVFLDLSIAANVSSLNIDQVSRARLFLDSAKEIRQAKDLGRQLNIKSAATSQRVSELSGGNQQKVAIAKLLSIKPKVLLMDEPTRGIDVSAKAEIHQLLRRLANEGVGVVVVSSELPELIGLCDRVLVMREGRVSGILEGGDITEEAVVDLAAGVPAAGARQELETLH